MKWKDKEISQLSNHELADVSFDLNKMYQTAMAKRNHPRFEKVFKNQPAPEVNPTFLQIQDEVQKELQKRGLTQ